MIRLTLILGFAAISASAQVDAPLLGYLPDSGSIRPVYGIPAAAGIAPPLNLSGFAQIAVSSQQDYAIASVAASGAVVLVFPGHGMNPLQGAAASPDEIVLSPAGSAAALWFSSAGRLQVISGLPESPSVREVNVSFLNAAPSTLAVSDDGAWVAGAWARGAYAFGSNGEVSRLPLRERAIALAFFRGRPDLAVATRLHVFSMDVGGGGATTTVYLGGTLDPAGLAVSSDNQQIVVAGRSGKVLALNLSAGSSSSIDCGCAPSGVFPMGRGILRLTPFDGATIKIFDTTSGGVFFVPLAATAAQGGQQ